MADKQHKRWRRLAAGSVATVALAGSALVGAQGGVGDSADTHELTVDLHRIIDDGWAGVEVGIQISETDRTTTTPTRVVTTQRETLTTDSDGEAVFDLIPTGDLVEQHVYEVYWGGYRRWQFAMPDNDARLSGLPLVDPRTGTGTTLTFPDLADTPNEYAAGSAGFVPLVNDTEDGLVLSRDLLDVETFTRTKLAANQIEGVAPITWAQDAQSQRWQISLSGSVGATTFTALTDTPSDYGTAGQLACSGGTVVNWCDPASAGSADDNVARAAAAAAQARADSAYTLADGKVSSVGAANNSPIGVSSGSDPRIDLISNTFLADRVNRVLNCASNIDCSWSTGDARVTLNATGGGGTSNAATWAQTGNTDTIPLNKITSDTPQLGDVVRVFNDNGTFRLVFGQAHAQLEHGAGSIRPSGGSILVTGAYYWQYDPDDTTSDVTLWYRNTTSSPGQDSDWSSLLTIPRSGSGTLPTFTANRMIHSDADGDLTANPALTGDRIIASTSGGLLRSIGAGTDSQCLRGDATWGGCGSGDDAFDWATVGNTDYVPQAKIGDGSASITSTRTYLPYVNTDDEDYTQWGSVIDILRSARGYTANRLIVTTANGIDEADAIAGNRVLRSNNNGLPTALPESQNPSTEYLRGDLTWEVPPGGEGDLETGLERVLNEQGLSANRSGSATSYAFTIPGVLLGERISIHALYNITTAGAANGSIGNIWLSTSDSSHDQHNLLGEFRGRVISDSPTLETNNLGSTRPVIDQTGRKAVVGADYFSFGSSDRTLYLWVPVDTGADADVRFDLQLYISRYSGEQGGGGTTVEANPGGSGLGALRTITIGDTSYDVAGDYDRLTDIPIHRVGNPDSIPTPSASNVGRRYQTNDGREYIIVRQTVAANDRVVDFESYSSTDYVGAVNTAAGVTCLTEADVGNWYLVRDSIDQGTAPFVLCATGITRESIASIPDSGVTYVHPHGHDFYRSENDAYNDHAVTATSAVIYSSVAGGSTWELYSVNAGTFVAGNPTHDEYVIANTDTPLDLANELADLRRKINGIELFDGDLGSVTSAFERIGTFAVPEEADQLLIMFGDNGGPPEATWFTVDVPTMIAERDAATTAVVAGLNLATASNYTAGGFVSVSPRSSTSASGFPDRDAFMAIGDNGELFIARRNSGARTYDGLKVRWR